MLKKMLYLCVSFLSIFPAHAHKLSSFFSYFSTSCTFSNEVIALAHEIESLSLSKYAPTMLVPHMRSNTIPEYLRVTPEELAQWREKVKSDFDFRYYCIDFGLVNEKKNKVSGLYARSTELLYSGAHVEKDFLIYRWYLDRSEKALEIMFLEMSKLAQELQKIKK